jgi:hypothetical protein
LTRLILLSLAIALVVPSGISARKLTALQEYSAKSIFIYKICKFTSWPEPAKPSQPFIISVIGKLPPGTGLEIPAGKKKIGKRRIVIQTIKRLEEIENSNVLFIASSEANRIGTILDYVSAKAILTVGDTKGFDRQGVIINFFIKKGNMGFTINAEAVKKANLVLHSQLYTVGDVILTDGLTGNNKR